MHLESPNSASSPRTICNGGEMLGRRQRTRRRDFNAKRKSRRELVRRYRETGRVHQVDSPTAGSRRLAYMTRNLHSTVAMICSTSIPRASSRTSSRSCVVLKIRKAHEQPTAAKARPTLRDSPPSRSRPFLRKRPWTLIATTRLGHLLVTQTHRILFHRATSRWYPAGSSEAATIYRKTPY